MADVLRPSTTPRSLEQVLSDLDAAPGITAHAAVLPTGFQPLDQMLGGGLRPHDLVLLGGAPGVGKTIAALQWARHTAASGRTAVYACYEHDEADLLSRLLLLELGAVAAPEDAPTVEKLRGVIAEVADGQRRLTEAAFEHPLLRRARAAVASYADRLWLVRASGRHTDVAELEALVADGFAEGEQPAVLFVDYLQKVAIHEDLLDEAEKVTRVTAGLKEVALSHGVTVVAVVAADRDALAARRLRLHHLRGSSALAYEADVVLLLNDKRTAIDDVHLEYDTSRAEQYRQWVVISIEKNRGGPTLIDLEVRKDFAHYRFDPEGRYLTERLADERPGAQ